MSILNIFRKNPAVSDAVSESFMLVGLGNPGRDYRETRHNIGFMTIDTFAAKHEIKLNKVQIKAITGSGRIADFRVILVKPQTFMNLSGQAVSSLARYYKIPLEHLIVAHDDVDLPFNTIRMRPAGGSAGQKGIDSIIKLLGTQQFARLRMGIGRPPGQMDAAGYVLQPFSRSEQEELRSYLERAVDALDCFMSEGLEAAMNRFNGSDLG